MNANKPYVNYMSETEARQNLTPTFFHRLRKNGWVDIGERDKKGLPKCVVVIAEKEASL